MDEHSASDTLLSNKTVFAIFNDSISYEVVTPSAHAFLHQLVGYLLLIKFCLLQRPEHRRILVREIGCPSLIAL
jgi:hypothetical protein